MMMLRRSCAVLSRSRFTHSSSGGNNLPTVVFDLDGTLVDSLGDIAPAINAVLLAEGRRELSAGEVRGMIGAGLAKLVRRAYTQTHEAGDGTPGVSEDVLAAAVAEALRVYTVNPCEHSVLYPGAKATLVNLAAAGWPLALCTNKPIAPTRGLLAALEIDHFFRAVSGGDSLPVKKPHAGHLLTVLAEAGGEERGCVMVGDGSADVGVARAAGFPVIGVTYGYTDREVMLEELKPDEFADSLPEVEVALQRWGDDGRDVNRSM